VESLEVLTAEIAVGERRSVGGVRVGREGNGGYGRERKKRRFRLIETQGQYSETVVVTNLQVKSEGRESVEESLMPA
jgi:hypothetical protein